jgi:hypothetical protein
MRPRPGEIDLAAAHGVVGALHTERADIDMGDHDGDEDHAHRGVDVLRPLDAVDLDGRKREQHDDAGRREGDTTEDHRPEDQLLASVEAAGRGMPFA